jgi:hypothetical protein
MVKAYDSYSSLKSFQETLTQFQSVPGYIGLSSAFGAGCSSWYEKNDFKPFLEQRVPFFTAAGYGFPNESTDTRPAAYFFQVISLLDQDDGYLIDGNFETLIQRAAEGLIVHLNSEIVKVDRNAGKLTLQSGESHAFDAFFITAPQELCQGTLTDASEEEKALFRSVQTFRYLTLVFKVPKGLPRRNLNLIVDAKFGTASAFAFPCSESDVCLIWGYPSESQSDDEFVNAVVDQFPQSGGVFKGSIRRLLLGVFPTCFLWRFRRRILRSDR